MSDPTAALAEAVRATLGYDLNANEVAAAILAALPPGWRTPLHDDPDDEARCDGRCARNECICSPEAYADETQRRVEIVAEFAALNTEIARLRKIEEAARTYIAARIIRETWAEAHGYIINSEFDALRNDEYDAEDALRAALKQAE